MKIRVMFDFTFEDREAIALSNGRPGRVADASECRAYVINQVRSIIVDHVAELDEFKRRGRKAEEK